MKRRAAPSISRPARWARGLRPDRNPLRRASDRAEAVIVAVLLAAFLAGAPLVSVLAGQWAYHTGWNAEHASRHQVPAVLLARAPPYASGGYGAGPEVMARWPVPGRAARTGEVPAPAGAKAGTTVMVWIDTSGRLTGLPLSHASVVARAALAAGLAPAALGLLLLCAGTLAHRALDRRRLAAWAADWRATGPQWTSRR